MKAQRRHELKTNALATKLVTMPDFWRKIAGRAILIGVLVVLGAIFAYRIWANKRDAKIAMFDEVETARSVIEQLRNRQVPDVQYAYEREAAEPLSHVIDNSSDPKLLAQAWLLRGDLNLVVAQTYWLPNGKPAFESNDRSKGMAIPSKSRDELLKAAADAYNVVVKQYPSDLTALFTAKFGLAAVAEDQAGSNPDAPEWALARQTYKWIMDNSDAPPFVQNLASARYKQLIDQGPNAVMSDVQDEIFRPILMGTPVEPATTRSSTTQSATTKSASTTPSAAAATTQSATRP